MPNIPKRYIPKNLSTKDKKKQKKELLKSRKNYRSKKGTKRYYTRKKMQSFKSKTSPHILNARKMYKVDDVIPNKKLSDATGCSIKALEKIVSKGKGAYFSSGSRPNQTAHSWGCKIFESGPFYYTLGIYCQMLDNWLFSGRNLDFSRDP